jgi:alanine racemase
MLLSRIANILNINGNFPDKEISGLLTDSRSLAFPSDMLFVAIETTRNDGHKYIADLYKQNVRYFIVNKLLAEFSEMPDAVFLKVENTLDALQKIAENHRSQFKIPVVGITGSNGKTIVKEWLYQLLHADFNIMRSPRSYNSQIGVSLSVWAINENTELGIFEAGISQTSEMERLQKIISPTIGIFTNLGDAHQENFSSLKQKAQEKLKLFTNSDILIYNSDDKLLDITVKQSDLRAKLFSWGKSNNATLQVLNIKKRNLETDILLKFGELKFSISIPFIDNASIENALQCVSLMLYLQISPEKIAEKIKLLEPVAMRLEVKEGINNSLIINDSYNSDINSLGIAIDFMKQQSAEKPLRRILILSDIVQSGFNDNELYSKVADLVESAEIELFIGIGEKVSKFAEKFNFIKSSFYSTTEEFLQSTEIEHFANNLILIKGSRKFHFENISKKLEKTIHETVLEVNLTALTENWNYFREKLRPETKIMSMVKAFGYGSGAVEVARILQHHHCDYVAVAVADEGVELRREGIKIPIVVMNPEKSGFELMFENNLEPEIYSFDLLADFIRAAEKLGITDYPVHVKIDSGMHRLGFELSDIELLVNKLKTSPQIKVRSVFSHLAAADNEKLDNFTKQQIQIFTQCADAISKAFNHKILRHILNSAGIERFPEFQFDMVRLGIGHYGISALKNANLRNVCTLKTIILQIKNVKRGETIGYGRRGIIEKDSKIAILPIGYADGYNRRLGNGLGEVYINGQRAKTVGNVCMDLLMVNVTNIEAREGNSVEIFGENVTISELADKLQTIPYEILTGVSRRVKRVYYNE